MSSGNQTWIAFLLRDKCASDYWKENLKKQILSKFKKNENDIFYFPFEADSSLIYYFFIKEDNIDDLRNIWQCNINFFQSFECHVKINDKELKDMKENVKQNEYNSIKYGDIVCINVGNYSKLYGVVLRQNRVGKFDVGFKFCFGNVIQSFSVSEMTVIDNIFKYIKVLC